jgi:hypothetical protein
MAVDKNGETYDSKERVDDVMNAISAYSDMVAIMFHSSNQNPIIPMLAAQWMSVLAFKFKEWGVLTDLEHDQLMHRVQAESAQRAAAIAAAQELPPGVEMDDGVKSLLAQLGI